MRTPVRSLEADVRRFIRDVPDFPKPGVVFKDITPLLQEAALFRRVTESMAAPFTAARVTHVVAIESRGFILGAPVAQHLDAAFIPVRKVGRLPLKTERVDYALEYGTDALEVHADSMAKGSNALIVDDVLATGGTAAATCQLVEQLGATVIGCSFLIALSFLPGRRALMGRKIEAVVTY